MTDFKLEFWLELALILFLVTSLLSLFSGCKVIRTTKIQSDEKYTLVYRLPETMLNVTAKAKVKVGFSGGRINETILAERTFEITPETFGSDQTYGVKYLSNWLSADNLKLEVNSLGLLSKAEVTTEDKTATIVENTIKGITDILILKSEKSGMPSDSFTTIEFTKTFKCPVSDLKPSTNIEWWLVVINDKDLADTKRIDASFTLNDEKTVEVIKTNTITKSDTFYGLLTHPMRNLKLGIQYNNVIKDTELPVTDYMYLNVFDNAHTIVVPFTRAPFVKNVSKVAFENGTAKSNEIDRPSSLEGFVSIPINVAKAIVSIPAQIVQFKFNVKKDDLNLEKEKLQYEKDKLELQKQQWEFKKELDSIKQTIGQ